MKIVDQTAAKLTLNRGDFVQTKNEDGVVFSYLVLIEGQGILDLETFQTFYRDFSHAGIAECLQEYQHVLQHVPAAKVELHLLP